MLQRIDGHGHRQVRLAGSGRADAEGDRVVADGLDVVVLAHRLRTDRLSPGGEDVRAQHRRGGRPFGGERRDPVDRLFVDAMAGRVELLEFPDDADEGFDAFGFAGDLDLVGPNVDVEVVEGLLQGAQIRFSGAEEGDEVDGVGDDQSHGVAFGTARVRHGIVACGTVTGCGGVRVCGVHGVRVRWGDVQNVPLQVSAPSPAAPECASILVRGLTNGPMNSGP